MKKRTSFLFILMATFAAVAIGSCGYVKVFNESSSSNLKWKKGGYQEVKSNSDAADVEAVAANLDALDITFAPGDSAENVTQNFTVPTEIDGCAIAWTASDGSAVTFADGVATVTRPAGASNATVTLTATITKGSASATKTIDIVVIRQMSDAEAVAACTETLSTSNITFSNPDTATAVTQDFTLPARISDCTVTWESGTPAVVSITGTAADVTRPAYTAENATVTLTATLSRHEDAGAEDTKDLTVTVTKAAMSDAEAVAACKAALDSSDIVYASSETSTTVKNDITLPATISDCNIVWTSGTPAVITVTGTAGDVTRPANGSLDATVTLTATITRNGNAADTKGVAVTVLAITDPEAVAACKAALTNGNITFTAPDTAAAVTQNFTLPGLFLGCSLSWSSGTPARISIAGGVNATVTRAYACSDHTVALTATISVDAASDSKAVNVVVSRLVPDVAADKAALVVGYNGGDSSASVTQSLTLSTAGATGTTISWVSNDTNHIPDGSSGTVNRGHGASNTLVTLTATIEACGSSDTKPFSNLAVVPHGTISAALGVGISSTVVNVLRVDADENIVDSDGNGAHTVEYKICVGPDGAAALNSISGMSAATDLGVCSTASGSPLVVGSTTTACCTSTVAATTRKYFSVPVDGSQTWRARVFAYVTSDPNEEHHKFLYDLSTSSINP